MVVFEVYRAIEQFEAIPHMRVSQNQIHCMVNTHLPLVRFLT